MQQVKNALDLKLELDKLRPIPKERQDKIMQKFRLDWNYHSNHLEGNSLTFGEAKMLILHGITAQGKPLKDHFEITGHDEAIKWVEEIVKSDFPLTENFIRQLHFLLLKEPYEVSAITPEGLPTRRMIEVGKYKSGSNHVLTKTGETFYFATPEETPAKMNDLLAWYRQEVENTDVNPIILAAEFHYKFILIHPFDDGNGRVARVLMNFILMKFGFPPVIIKTEDKENYFSALRQADGDLIENFIDYIAKNLVCSLEIMIAGAKGENIDEQDDLDKKISLLKWKFKGEKNKILAPRSKKVLLKIYDDSVVRFFESLMNYHEKFKEFYLKEKIELSVSDSQTFALAEFYIGSNAIKKARVHLNDDSAKARMRCSYEILNHQGRGDFKFETVFVFHFKSETYELANITKTYNEQITNEEIAKLIREESERHFEAIKEKLRNKI